MSLLISWISFVAMCPTSVLISTVMCPTSVLISTTILKVTTLTNEDSFHVAKSNFLSNTMNKSESLQPLRQCRRIYNWRECTLSYSYCLDHETCVTPLNIWTPVTAGLWSKNVFTLLFSYRPSKKIWSHNSLSHSFVTQWPANLHPSEDWHQFQCSKKHSSILSRTPLLLHANIYPVCRRAEQNKSISPFSIICHQGHIHT